MVETQGDLSEQWGLIAASVRGAKHIQSGLPNQDAYQYKRAKDYLFLATADGHGSLKYFRSQIGAKLAVEAAEEVIIKEALVDGFDPKTLPLVKERVKEKLPVRIVKSWREKVEQYQEDNPFVEDETALAKLKEIETKQGPELREQIESSSDGYLKAYGSTLTAVLVTEHFILYLQLGDGDIVTMSQWGEVTRVFADDQLGNATNSLSMADPAPYFKISLTSATKKKPNLFFIATDGYANSFRSEEDFFKVADDFAELLPKQGPQFLKDNLPTWLKETTEAGSGDDITVLLAYQNSLLTEQENSEEFETLQARKDD
ncbi:PP2C family serine/threonine-protein phosphatase [Fuchsiella alkaliacetigena]|uniref:PP2C family serine/threonine-protein phosphatase n=1 Tax=Fuchsiella alkaliacetigena TaxID=957042 RepID=UPI00200AC75A|nr:PP2C family serine/threonine-protein phosphatase [Fuchsiella alkaliacetigena]MCK8823583.1 protein phosphatase 2C domain-containing protein [Fuchsiella alkaliacetigena]